MKSTLEPLAQLPGVRLVALVSHDGVPVAVPGMAAEGGEDAGQALRDVEALAALSAGWVGELTGSLALLSCEAPQRVTLRAARGTLLVLRTQAALLLVVLEAGLGPDEVWLPMEGVAARIQRSLNGMGRTEPEEDTPIGDLEDTPSALPAKRELGANLKLAEAKGSRPRK